MKEQGYSDDKIKQQQYFNPKLFRGCIDRHAPPPAILYWRVQAVFATYGTIIDSKTKAPLFNDRAWKKSGNLLKEILEGYYSNPPGITLYNKRLNSDGTVMKNEYSMEMIELARGTNRTEAYHKNIINTFGTWSKGVEMSDCLLREKRHRHNQNVSENRRSGFPRIGHYDTWLIKKLMKLVMHNHGWCMYPGLCNTSEYKFTDESFDTIALHTKGLNDAINNRYVELDKAKIKLI
jgi:hypothetical protein